MEDRKKLFNLHLDAIKMNAFPLMKLTPDMVDGSFTIEVMSESSVPYEQRFIERNGKKYMCTKIANEDWNIVELDKFPFSELPDDLFTKV